MTPQGIATSADGMLRNFGREALEMAQSQVRRYEKAGDSAAVQTWQSILEAIRSKSRSSAAQTPGNAGATKACPDGGRLTRD